MRRKKTHNRKFSLKNNKHLRWLVPVGILLLWTVVTSAFPFFEQWRIARQVEAARATVDASASTTQTEHLASAPTVVVVSNTNAYAFYVDSGGQCVYSKTTNLNAATPTWGAAVQIDSQTDCMHIAVWYDRWTPGDNSGTYIHIITMDANPDDLWYNRLDTSTDTRLLTAAPVTISSSAAPNKTNTFVTTANIPALTKATDGTLYAGVFDDAAATSWVHKCSTTCNTASNWTDESPDFETATFAHGEANVMLLMPQPNNDIMMIVQHDTTEDVIAKIYDQSLDTWGSYVTIDNNAPNNTTYDGTMGATIDRSTYEIYLVYAAQIATIGTDDDIRTAIYDPVDATWTAKTNAITDLAITNAKVSMDESSGTVYAVYVRRTTAGTATTGNVFFKSSTDKMTTWSSESAALQTTADDLYGLGVNILSNENVYTTWYDLAADDINGNTVVDITPGTHVVEQAVYRIYANANSADVGTPRAASNTPYTLTSRGEAFRIRMLLKVTTANLATNGQDFKLQFAHKGAGSCTAPETTYRDVSSTTPIAYVNNASPADNTVLTANANDPTNGGDTIVNQTYEEANNFTNSQGAINTSQNGKWDFPLVDNAALATETYCLRAVKGGGELLNTYTQFPEITIADPPTLDQSNYRLYANADSTDVGAALAAQNTPYTLTAPKQAFRLRMVIGFSGNGALAGGQGFKLQFAGKGAGTCAAPSGTPSTYTDVSTTTAIAYNNNATPADGAALTGNANDPTSTNTLIDQTYVEANNFTNAIADIAPGEDGLWDLSLIDYEMINNQDYCLRAVRSSGSGFDTYTQYPEVTAFSGAIDKTPGTVAADFQNTGSNVVFVSDQTGYVFYKDSAGSASYKKTTDGGATWGDAITVDSQTDIAHVVVWYDQWTPGNAGNLIHVLTGDTGNDDLWYIEFDTSDDSFSTPVSAVASSSQGGSIASGSSLPSISVSATGGIVAGIIDNGDNYVVGCTTTCTNGANWAEAGTAPFGNQNDSLILFPHGVEDIIAVVHDKTANTLNSRIYDVSAGTWGSVTSIAANTENSAFDANIGAFIDENLNLYLIATNDTSTLGTNDDVLSYYYDATSSTWSTTGAIITNDTRGITEAKVIRDSASGDIYAVYVVQETAGNAATSNIYYKVSTDDMSTWGSEQGPINAAQADILGMQTNGGSDERAYVTWYDNATVTFMGESIADLVAGPSPTPSLTPTPGLYLTPTFIQSNLDAYTTSATSQTSAFASNVTTGNLIVVAISHWNAGNTSTISSITDTQGNTYQEAVSQPATETGATEPLAIWYAYNITGGANTVTVNNAASADMTIAIHEYSGFGTSDPLDQTANATGTGTAVSSGNTATTTQTHELLFAAANHDGTDTTATAGTSYTMREVNDDNTNSETLYTEDRNVTATGAYAGTFTYASSRTYRAALATFKTAVDPGGPTPTPSLTPTPSPQPSAYAYHTPMFEQLSTSTVTQNTTINTTFSNPVKNGNLIVVAIGENDLGAAVVNAVTDNKGNTYTRILSEPTSEFGSAGPLVLYYAYNVTGGASFQVTVTNASSADMAVAIHEYSGIDTTDPLDKTAKASSSSSSTVSSGNTTTTALADELIFGAASKFNGTATVTAGTNFTGRANINDSNPHALYTEDRRVSATGTYAATFGVSTFYEVRIAVATFKAAPGPQNDQIMRHGKYFDNLRKKFWPFGF